ncbi:hypothetical protein HYH02_004887 [Chlamydomonas schloesseri]|uniref:PUM-HD domain-containing protein n=1 Tax=Chlamydomonas schloesseri TaxID=2026947 RepID=A0A836B8I1_9CHLO|nr:hypothetical protein HYH02_004887 [Chlamydomonas schloesseri]|eukprot:KAG2450384.1 hypothetical protein HYH02_004887 [Chlamydomonas schloesseri]
MFPIIPQASDDAAAVSLRELPQELWVTVASRAGLRATAALAHYQRPVVARALVGRQAFMAAAMAQLPHVTSTKAGADRLADALRFGGSAGPRRGDGVLVEEGLEEVGAGLALTCREGHADVVRALLRLPGFVDGVAAAAPEHLACALRFAGGAGLLAHAAAEAAAGGDLGEDAGRTGGGSSLGWAVVWAAEYGHHGVLAALVGHRGFMAFVVEHGAARLGVALELLDGAPGCVVAAFMELCSQGCSSAVAAMLKHCGVMEALAVHAPEELAEGLVAACGLQGGKAVAVVQVLLRNGGYMAAVTGRAAPQLQTALALARERRNQAVLQLLEVHGGFMVVAAGGWQQLQRLP